MSNIINQKTRNDSFALQTENGATALFNADDIPRMILDEEQNIIFCNDPLHRLCGAIEGAHISDIFTTEQKLKDGTNKVSLKENKQEINFQVDWVPTASGKKYMVASTEAKIDSSQLQNYVEEKLKPQNNFNSAPFINLSFDACSITDENGQFVTINENFTTLFGYNFNDLSNKKIFDFIHENDVKNFKESISQLIQSKHEQHCSIETYCLNKEGKTLWVEWRHKNIEGKIYSTCLLYTSPSPRDGLLSRMPSSA